jgi:hypothetical protein
VSASIANLFKAKYRDTKTALALFFIVAYVILAKMKPSRNKLSTADKILITELNEDSVLRIIKSCKQPLQMQPILADDRIPINQRSHFLRILQILKYKKLVRTDELTYEVTNRGRWKLADGNTIAVISAGIGVLVSFLLWYYRR